MELHKDSGQLRVIIDVSYKSKLEEYRKDATDEIGAQIVHEFQGLVKASI